MTERMPRRRYIKQAGVPLAQVTYTVPVTVDNYVRTAAESAGSSQSLIAAELLLAGIAAAKRAGQKAS